MLLCEGLQPKHPRPTCWWDHDGLAGLVSVLPGNLFLIAVQFGCCISLWCFCLENSLFFRNGFSFLRVTHAYPSQAPLMSMGCCCLEGSPKSRERAQLVPARDGKGGSRGTKVSSRLRECVTASACSGSSAHFLIVALDFYCLH